MFPMVKVGVHIMSLLGVSKVVNDIIQNNTTIVTTFDAIKVNAGSLVIGSIVADAAANHVEQRINEVTTWLNRNNPDTPPTP